MPQLCRIPCILLACVRWLMSLQESVSLWLLPIFCLDYMSSRSVQDHIDFKVYQHTRVTRFFMSCLQQMTKSSPDTLLPMLLLLLSPRPRPPGPCFPKRASQVCGPRVSALVVSPRVAWQLSASSGAPVCRLSPRPSRPTAWRATPAGQLTVSPPHTCPLVFEYSDFGHCGGKKGSW